MPTMKKVGAAKARKYQEGGRVRAGNPGQRAVRMVRDVEDQEYNAQERMRQNEMAANADAERGALMSAARPSAPARSRVRRVARPASETADSLNDRVLRLTRGGTPQDDTDRRLADRMGIAYKKGGMIKGKK